MLWVLEVLLLNVEKHGKAMTMPELVVHLVSLLPRGALGHRGKVIHNGVDKEIFLDRKLDWIVLGLMQVKLHKVLVTTKVLQPLQVMCVHG